ncbi:MAG TPA: hypothetical protein VGR85_08810 [Candidatus Limnocylindria bacterium]|jgi:hypothetical protein|nr:hypothetical protein [Candidatus Limnocylindria bacterium]
MLRILSALAALAMASTTLFVASSHSVSPTTSSSATTSAITTPAKTTGTQGTTTTTSTTSVATTGNGAPSGSHYNLNIIGVPKDKTAAMTTGDGHRIFVQLQGGEDAVSLNGKLSNQLLKANKILLQAAPAGESFQVLDANATDNNGALFQLPSDVSATWSVWGRALGTPGGKAKMTTCASTAGLDLILGTADDEVICSMGTLSLDRTKGKQTFTNVSGDLLFIAITVDPTTNTTLATCLGVTSTSVVTLSLFNGCLQNYFWNYDNQGLKLLQLRFYPGGFGT